MADRTRGGRRRGRTGSVVALVGAGALVAGAVVGLGGCDQSPERSTEAYCAQVGRVTGLDQVLAAGDTPQAGAMLGELRTLQEVAPTDIEPQVAVLVGVLADLQTTAATVGSPQAAAREVFARRQAEIPAITQAGADVEAYTQRTCNVTLNATAGTVPGSVPGTLPATTTSTAGR